MTQEVDISCEVWRWQSDSAVVYYWWIITYNDKPRHPSITAVWCFMHTVCSALAAAWQLGWRQAVTANTRY